jgi:hypothetical protein
LATVMPWAIATLISMHITDSSATAIRKS